MLGWVFKINGQQLIGGDSGFPLSLKLRKGIGPEFHPALPACFSEGFSDGEVADEGVELDFGFSDPLVNVGQVNPCGTEHIAPESFSRGRERLVVNVPGDNHRPGRAVLHTPVDRGVMPGSAVAVPDHEVSTPGAVHNPDQGELCGGAFASGRSGVRSVERGGVGERLVGVGVGEVPVPDLSQVGPVHQEPSDLGWCPGATVHSGHRFSQPLRELVTGFPGGGTLEQFGDRRPLDGVGNEQPVSGGFTEDPRGVLKRNMIVPGGGAFRPEVSERNTAHHDTSLHRPFLRHAPLGFRLVEEQFPIRQERGEHELSLGSCRVDAFMAGREDFAVRGEFPDDGGAVRDGAGEPVDFHDDDAVGVSGPDVLECGLEAGPVGVASGEVFVGVPVDDFPAEFCGVGGNGFALDGGGDVAFSLAAVDCGYPDVPLQAVHVASICASERSRTGMYSATYAFRRDVALIVSAFPTPKPEGAAVPSSIERRHMREDLPVTPAQEARPPRNLPDEVLEEAVRAYIDAASIAGYGTFFGEIKAKLSEAAPVLTSYAYRKGREDALAEARERVADPTDPGDREIHDAIYKAAYVIKDAGGRFGEFGEEIPRVAKDAVEAFLASLAGEKEEGCPDTVTVTVDELVKFVTDAQAEDVIWTARLAEEKIRAALSGTGKERTDGQG